MPLPNLNSQRCKSFLNLMMLRLLHLLFLRISTSLENKQLVFVHQTFSVKAKKLHILLETPQWRTQLKTNTHTHTNNKQHHKVGSDHWLYSQPLPPYLQYASNCSYTWVIKILLLGEEVKLLS